MAVTSCWLVVVTESQLGGWTDCGGGHGGRLQLSAALRVTKASLLTPSRRSCEGHTRLKRVARASGWHCGPANLNTTVVSDLSWLEMFQDERPELWYSVVNRFSSTSGSPSTGIVDGSWGLSVENAQNYGSSECTSDVSRDPDVDSRERERDPLPGCLSPFPERNLIF